jgi:hypothetical protein
LDASNTPDPLGFVFSQRTDFQRTLETAWAVAAGDCASAIGIDYRPTAPPEAARSVGGTDGLLGLTSSARAARFGYIVDPSGTDPGDVGDPAAILSDDERIAFDRAVFGPPESRVEHEILDHSGNLLGSFTLGDGCMLDFYTSFFGSFERYQDYLSADMRVQNALNIARTRLASDPEFVSTRTAWSECMRNAGYAYDDPFDPFSRTWEEPRPSPVEVDIATKDVACKLETNFLPIARQRRSDIETTVAAQEGVATEIQLLNDLFDHPGEQSARGLD